MCSIGKEKTIKSNSKDGQLQPNFFLQPVELGAKVNKNVNTEINLEIFVLQLTKQYLKRYKVHVD